MVAGFTTTCAFRTYFPGADINAKNILGQTPLMRAVLYDDIESVKLLHHSGKYKYKSSLLYGV
jgi:ankyrin repeat protein